MPRKSPAQKRNEELESQVMNAESILRSVRSERDKAQELAAHLDHRNIDLLTAAKRTINIQKKLLRMVYASDLKTARLEGYIDHVREASITASGVQEPTPGVDYDYERDRLLNAGERQFGKIIDGMDSEVLDVLLGRDDDDDIPF